MLHFYSLFLCNKDLIVCFFCPQQFQHKRERGKISNYDCGGLPWAHHQGLPPLGWNRVPKLLWDVVSSRDLWNSWISVNRGGYWSFVFPFERNLLCSAPSWPSRLDGRTSWRQTRGLRCGTESTTAESMESNKTKGNPASLSGLQT